MDIMGGGGNAGGKCFCDGVPEQEVLKLCPCQAGPAPGMPLISTEHPHGVQRVRGYGPGDKPTGDLLVG